MHCALCYLWRVAPEGEVNVEKEANVKVLWTQVSMREGLVIGALTWTKVPELWFEVRMRRGGDLLEVNVKAREGHRISARRLRLAPIGEMQRAIHAQLEIFGRGQKLGDPIKREEGGKWEVVTEEDLARDRDEVQYFAELAESFRNVPRPGAAGRNERDYAALARLYVGLLGEKKPTEALARQVGVSPKTASNLLYKAREKGMLTPTVRGKAGGELTDKAKRLLAGEKD